MFKKVSGLLLALCLASAAGAQEGHPLVGTWQGEWGPDNANFLTVILYWDGKEITGIVNPGPDQGELKVAALDSSDWSVRLELDLKDNNGQPVTFVSEGTLENIGSQTRVMNGEWSTGSASGTYTLARQSGP